MWQAVKALLLGKAVLLTPNPIDIGDKWVQVIPPSALSAVEAEAHLEILVPWPRSLAAAKGSRVDELEGKYAHGCVRAELLTADDKHVSLKVRYATPTKAGAELILVAHSPVPLDLEFNRVRLRATCPLSQVTVHWRSDGKKPEAK